MQKNFMNSMGVFSTPVAVVLALSVKYVSSKESTRYGSTNLLTIDSWNLQLHACQCGEMCSFMSVALYCLSSKVEWGHVSWGFSLSTLKSQEAQEFLEDSFQSSTNIYNSSSVKPWHFYFFIFFVVFQHQTFMHNYSTILFVVF